MTKGQSASDRTIRLGTRSSALARWQADWVAERLRETGCDVELVFIQTTGDVTTGSLQTSGGQGLFTKEIQRALLDDRVDLAVHSLKDLPTEPVDGLALAAVPPRESTHDAFVSQVADSVESLQPGARVGTGSRRRRTQLLHWRSDLEVLDIRGNVDTRLSKLAAGQFDAILLAEAGLRRLGLADRISQVLPKDRMLPAVGQGALGLETRADDEQTRRCLQPLHDEAAFAEVTAERTMLAHLRAGCLAPVGAWSRWEEDQLVLRGAVLSLDGRQRLIAESAGPATGAEAIGRHVAEQLIDQGADALIEAAHQ